MHNKVCSFGFSFNTAPTIKADNDSKYFLERQWMSPLNIYKKKNHQDGFQIKSKKKGLWMPGKALRCKFFFWIHFF